MNCLYLHVQFLAIVLALTLPQVIKAQGGWSKAHATFYEGGSGTFGGACGYKDVVQQGYGLETAAVSGALFQEGKTCGACFELRCVDDPKWCRPGQPSLFVTATNLCPPGGAGWCNQPRHHFDIAKPVFHKLATDYKCGIIPVQYRRVRCKKQGGLKFTITGNPYFNEVQVWNVAGAGDVVKVQVKGDKTQWIDMKRLWGQKWQTGTRLVGQSLSFKVQTTDGKTTKTTTVAPTNWQFGRTYEGKNNLN